MAARGTHERGAGACKRVRSLEGRVRRGSNSGGTWRRVPEVSGLKFLGFVDLRP